MDPELDCRIREAIIELKRLPRPDRRSRQRLDRRLAIERSATRSDKLARPGAFPVILSRAGAFAATAAIVVLTSAVWAAALTLGRGGAATSDTRTTPVQFVLIAPDARSVSLVGDFNEWDAGASPLREGDDGVWSVVVPLARGAFAYSFVIDGDEWRADPTAPAAPDDFGRPSSVVYVSPESGP